MSRLRYKRLGLAPRLRGLAVAAVAFGGCSSLEPTEPALPAGAQPLSIAAQYAEWFQRTEACSGLKGQFTQIQWLVVPDADVFETAAGPKVGMWEKSGSVARIIIAGHYTNHEMVVRHEMLHHLLDREGHPAEYFESRCKLTWETWPTHLAGQ
ncbi:MAG: hypothetical protein R2882_15585 [Gemmatimonadales bacterium]